MESQPQNPEFGLILKTFTHVDVRKWASLFNSLYSDGFFQYILIQYVWNSPFCIQTGH